MICMLVIVLSRRFLSRSCLFFAQMAQKYTDKKRGAVVLRLQADDKSISISKGHVFVVMRSVFKLPIRRRAANQLLFA